MKLDKYQKEFFVVVALIALLGWWDVMQITPFHMMNTDPVWQLYASYTATAFLFVGVGLMVLLGFAAYLLTKDKGLGLGVFAAGTIMFFSGVEDVFFFIIGPWPMTSCMDWFNKGHHITSYVGNFFGVACVSPTILVGTAVASVVLAYFVYQYLRVKY